MSSRIFIGVLLSACVVRGYNPGSPDRSLSVLQTAEITPNKTLCMRSLGRASILRVEQFT